MCANWNPDYNSTVLAAQLEHVKVIRDGQVSFREPGYSDSFAVLLESVNLDSNVPKVDRDQVVRDAVFAAGNEGAISVKSLIKHISRKEREFLAKPLQAYVLVTSLSTIFSRDLRNASFHRNTISFTKQLPPSFARERITLEKHAKTTLGIVNSPDYTAVRVRAKARSVASAMDLALDAIDCIRGMWNLGLNYGSYPMFPAEIGPRRPHNRIYLGPMHTLHLPSGKLAAEVIRYEVGNEIALPPIQIKDWQQIRKFEYWVRRCLASINERSFMERLLIRYARSLDGRDYEASFLKLWALLETVTITSRLPYSRTIERALFIYKDPSFHSLVLKHLQDSRNQATHFDGQNSRQIITMLFQIRRYVENLLMFALRHLHQFRTLDEFGVFLELPTDSVTLRRRAKMLQMVKRFHKL